MNSNMTEIEKRNIISHNTIRLTYFIYADEMYVTAQFPEVEHTIEEALDELTTYYRSVIPNMGSTPSWGQFYNDLGAL